MLGVIVPDKIYQSLPLNGLRAKVTRLLVYCIRSDSESGTR